LRPSILSHRPWVFALAAGALALPLCARPLAAQAKGHPKLTVRATPNLGTAPLKVLAVAELAGGADDDKDYYCPRVEWTWDDQTTSQEKTDCDPYVPGKSQIERRYSTEHQYIEGGEFNLTVRLYQDTRVIVAARTTVHVSGRFDIAALTARLFGALPPARP
jgi:hypothetical protein